VHKADNLPPSCAVVTKSGNLNFLEPSGSLRACNGTAVRFYNIITLTLHINSVILGIKILQNVKKIVNERGHRESTEMARFHEKQDRYFLLHPEKYSTILRRIS